MSEDRNSSPFSALTYAEQQDRWREWRSRQLDYQSAESLPPVELPRAQEPAPAENAENADAATAPLAVPRPTAAPAPTRHRQLDALAAKHKNARRAAVNWRPV